MSAASSSSGDGGSPGSGGATFDASSSSATALQDDASGSGATDGGGLLRAPRRHERLGLGLRLLGREAAAGLLIADAVVVVEAPLLALIDPRFGADARRAADRGRGMGDADRRGFDRGVGQGNEAGLVTVDVDEHPFRAPGLAVEVDLAHTAESLPARVEDVATGPFAVVPELGL
jgi:hypothetical protein